jgi:hypothetical protein
MFRRMKREAPDKKWSRLQAQVQEGIAKAYPNPDRQGCPSQEVIVDLAKLSARFDDSIEKNPQWQHVTHCSPCYTQYLEEFQIQRNQKRLQPTD